MCLSTTFIMSLATVVILFCTERSLVAGQKIKPNEGTQYEFIICQSQSHVEAILNRNCQKKRKRILTGRSFYV